MDRTVPAGPGKYITDNDNKKSADVWSGVYHEDEAFFYDEWVHVREHYRKNCCVVREVNVSRIYDDFVPQTLAQHMSIVKSLRLRGKHWFYCVSL